MNVAKLVMSSATEDTSTPADCTIRTAIVCADLLQLLQGDGVHRVPEPPVIQRVAGILVNRSAAVVFHQSANAAFEHGATSRFSAASARYVPVDSGCPAGRGPVTSSMMPATPRSSSMPHAAATAPNSLCRVRSGRPSPPPRIAARQLISGAQVLLRDDPAACRPRGPTRTR